jgi:hypothetical protein
MVDKTHANAILPHPPNIVTSSSPCSLISITPTYCFKWKFPELPNLKSAHRWNVFLFRKTKSTIPHTFTPDRKFLWAPRWLWQCGKMGDHLCHQTVKTIFNTEDVGNKCRGRWGKIYNALGENQQCTDRSCHHQWQGFQFPFLVNSCTQWYNYPKLQDQYKKLILVTT